MIRACFTCALEMQFAAQLDLEGHSAHAAQDLLSCYSHHTTGRDHCTGTDHMACERPWQFCDCHSCLHDRLSPHTLTHCILCCHRTVATSTVLIFAELDWADTIAKFAVLARWVWRGLALTFVGLLTLEFSGDNTEGKTAAYFVKAIAWITIGLGVIYFLMGLTRVNKLKEKKQAEYETKLSEPAAAPAPVTAAPASAV
eukprot:7919-Heterococcus_DN1.PRE.1